MDPFLGRPAMHTGVDFRAAAGYPARATAGGTVITAEYTGGYGNMVEIDHGNGITTRYGHLSRIDVTVGQVVAKGAIVGRAGSTGRSTGPHLHYEVRVDGAAIDPMRYIKAGSEIAPLLDSRSSASVGYSAARLAADALGQRRLHERHQVAVSTSLRAGALDAGAQVLHQLVGLQHVGADLVAPADVGLRRRRRPRPPPRASPARPRRAARAASSTPSRGSCAASARSGTATTMPVGMWVRRTAESVVLTCWPPAPDER